MYVYTVARQAGFRILKKTNTDLKAGASDNQTTIPKCRVCSSSTRKALGVNGEASLLQCGRCKLKEYVYCSKECQKHDWKLHRVVCKPAL